MSRTQTQTPRRVATGNPYPNPNLPGFHQRPHHISFFKHAKGEEHRPYGILQKLDTLKYAIVFYRQAVLQDNVLEGRHHMSLNASEALRRL